MDDNRLTMLRQQVQDGQEAQQAYTYLTPFMNDKREALVHELSTAELSSIKLERAHVALRLLHDLEQSFKMRISAATLAEKELREYEV